MISEMLSAGWALVPVPLGQKGPTQPGWNTRDKCVLQPSDSSALEGMNIGLAHAYCLPTPTCAIDIDSYKESKKWLVKKDFDLDAQLFAPSSVVVWSGKKNSLKLFYRLPQDVGALVSKQVKGMNGEMVLEFRCAAKNGTTLQDLIPPSVHPTGSRYQWVGNGSAINMPEIPIDLLNIWRKLKTTKRICDRPLPQRHGPLSQPKVVLISPRPETPRQIAVIKELLTHVSADCTRDVWRDIVWSIMSTGWTCAVDLAKTWSQSAPSRYEEDAFWTLVNSYDANRVGGPSLGTLYFHVRERG